MVKLLIIFCCLMVFSSCEKIEKSNPLNPNVIPNPIVSLSLSTPEVCHAILVWEDTYTGETGFIISKSINGQWVDDYIRVPENITVFRETIFPGDYYQYAIQVYYGDNKSEKTYSETIFSEIPTPENFALIVIPDGVILSWQYPYEGISGYSLHKSYNGEDWFILQEHIDDSVYSYTDYGFEGVSGIVKYRIAAKFQDFLSNFAYSDDQYK